MTGVVRNSSGEPVPGANAVLTLEGNSLSIRNGYFRNFDRILFRDTTDSSGKFHFNPQNKNYVVTVLHDDGFAFHSSKDGRLPDALTLTPWGTISGTFHVGDSLGRSVPLDVSWNEVNLFDPDMPRVYAGHTVTTDDQGKFQIDRAFPGNGWIGREITFMVNEGATEATSSRRITFEIAAGQTLSLNLGGDGIPVMGRLLFNEKVDFNPRWSLVHISLNDVTGRPDPPPVPDDIAGDPIQSQQWIADWIETSAGADYKQAMTEYRKMVSSRRSGYIYASANADGEFRIDDVPAGDYELRIRGDDKLPIRFEPQQFHVPDSGTVQLGDVEVKSRINQ